MPALMAEGVALAVMVGGSLGLVWVLGAFVASSTDDWRRSLRRRRKKSRFAAFQRRLDSR